ncbi:hypothetical protein Q4E40_02805 [Pontibacter sp. BT731]|uniref:hypothetical protein n=1 Tax=Pontibacter coccineus TaxID=3063328 RepID=UPI0026E3C18C|nr:hypothetical protein [Pontibacter sp. BT731]MDO6389043.1 hypothetical protein [Pontibacter sp. BT731]
MTQYIQIKKADSKYFVDPWYKNSIGLIMPVKHHQGGVYFGEGRSVPEEDCTPFQFAPLQEDQHLITTEQLKRLHDLCSNGYTIAPAEALQEWFPHLCPAKTTYKVGDRFVWPSKNKNTYRIIYLHNSEVGMFIEESDCLAWGNRVQVADKNNITEDELQSLTSYRFGMFTKLPDNTEEMI